MARAPRRTPRNGAQAPAGMVVETLTATSTWASSWASLNYNPSQLVGRQGLAIFDQMMIDDQIKAALNFKQDAALASGWEVVSPEGEDDSWPVAEFVRRQLEGMNPSLNRVLRDILSAMRYGYSISEKVYEVVPTGSDAGYVGVKSIKTKRPHSLRFELDDFANILGIINDGQAGIFPAEKFIVYTYGDSLQQPYGQSDLESAYRPWVLTNNTYKWMGQYLERMGVPAWVALFNPKAFQSTGALEEVKRLLTGMQAATAGAIPRVSKDDLELWSPPQTGNVQVLFVPALEHLKKDAARALLMPGFLGITPDNMGSYARARVTFDVFLLHLATVQLQLAGLIQQQLVRQLVDFNFETGGAYPIFRFLPLTEDNVQQIASTWASLVDRDIVNTEPDDEDYLRTLLGFPRRGADETEGEDDSVRRIPFRYVEKLARAFTINEVRAALGHEAVEWGDKPMDEQAQPKEPDKPDGEDGEEGEGRDPIGNLGGQQDDSGDTSASGDPGERAIAKAESDPAEKGEALAARAPERPFEDPAKPTVTPDDFDVTDEPPSAPQPPPPADDPSLSLLERRVDLAGVVGRLDGLEEDVAQRVAAAVRSAMRAYVDALATKRLTPARAAKLAVKLPPRVNAAFLAGLRKALRMGRTDARAEVGRKEESFAPKAQANYDPKAAMEALSGWAEFYVTGLNGKLAEIVRSEVLFGLQNGLPFSETRNRLLDALAPYIGNADADPKALRPDRLLTTVRTNATRAYNHGRLVEARQLGELGIVKAMQYSAVLDNRTTEVCRHLHHKTFRIDDPNLDRFTPPNHYRCRSILLPVPLYVDDLPYITPEELAEAQRLAPGNFGGSFTSTKANKPAPPPPPPPAPTVTLTPAKARKAMDQAASRVRFAQLALDDVNRALGFGETVDPAVVASVKAQLEEAKADLVAAVRAALASGAKMGSVNAIAESSLQNTEVWQDYRKAQIGERSTKWNHGGHVRSVGPSELAWHEKSWGDIEESDPLLLQAIQSTRPLVAVDQTSKRAFFSFSTNTIDQDELDIARLGARSIFRHEFGHAIDYDMAIENAVPGRYLHSLSAAQEMVSDAERWLEPQKNYRALYDTFRNSLPATGRKEFLEGKLDEITKELGLHREDLWYFTAAASANTEQVMMDQYLMALSIKSGDARTILSRLGLAAQAGRLDETTVTLTADFFGAISRNQVGFGHATEYYNPEPGRGRDEDTGITDRQSTEAFANYISLRGSTAYGQVASTERIVRALAPRTTAAFDAMLKEFVEARSKALSR